MPGCAISQITSGFGGGIFGDKSGNNVGSKPSLTTVSQQNLLDAAKTDTGFGNLPGYATGCPQFVIWPTDRLLTVYEDGKIGDGLAVKHRGEITKTARECQISPGQIGVKYGFAGRVLLGPKGVSGTVVLPVLVHVTDKDRNKIKTEKLKIAVNISKESPIGYFSKVKVVKFPITTGTRVEDYKLYVAFDKLEN